MSPYSSSKHPKKESIWKTIDLGQHSLRWSELVHTKQQESQTNQIDQVTLNHILTLDRLALCELDLLQSASHLNHSSLGRTLRFPQWTQVDQLSSSPFLGMITRNDTETMFGLNGPKSEHNPLTAFTRWFSDSLTPEKLLGAETPPIHHSLLWLHSSNYLPNLSSLIYQCLSELPYTHGSYLNRSIATLIGLSEPEKPELQSGVWGILDLGTSQASWHLVEATKSYVPQHMSYKILQSYGRSFVGERALRRSLLNDHLLRNGYTWSDMNTQLRQEWLNYISLQADRLIKQEWPKGHLSSSELDFVKSSVKLEQTELRLFEGFQHASFEAVLSWIKESLKQTNMGPEALQGILVTGKQGLSLIPRLKKAICVVNIKAVPFGIEHTGAQRYINSVLFHEEQGYHIEDVSPHALILRDEAAGLSKELFVEQTQVPCLIEVEIGESAKELSLWLSNQGELEQKIAFLPYCDSPTRLQIYYESPQLFELTWLNTDQDPNTPVQWIKL